MFNTKLKKTALSALLAAICFIVTRLIAIPSFYTKGYINIGDCAVLLCAFVPGGIYGALAAAIGSALSDLTAGYPVYVPATFVIKGLMVLAAYPVFLKAKNCKSHAKRIALILVGCVTAEIIMVAGYFLYELALYGAAAVLSIVGNLIQAVTCAVIGTAAVYAFSLNKSVNSILK